MNLEIWGSCREAKRERQKAKRKTAARGENKKGENRGDFFGGVNQKGSLKSLGFGLKNRNRGRKRVFGQR